MKLFSNSKRSSENIKLEDSFLDQERKERKKIKLPKINKSYSNLYTGSLIKTVNNNNDEEKTNAQNNNNKGIKFEKIDYAKKIKEANEMKELKQIYDKWLLNRSLRKDEEEPVEEQIKKILNENSKSRNASSSNYNNNNLFRAKTNNNGTYTKKTNNNKKKVYINVDINGDDENKGNENGKKLNKTHTINAYNNINNSKLKSDNEKLNNALKEKENLIKDLKKYKSNLESKIRELENNNYYLQGRIDDFENDIKEKDEEISEIKKEKEFLDKNGNDYKNKLDEILNEKNNLEIKTNEDKIKIDELNRQIKELKKNYNIVNKEKNKLNNKYISLNEDNNNLKEENKNFKSKNFNLNQENIDLNEKIKKLEEEIKKKENMNFNQNNTNFNSKKVNKSETVIQSENIITEEREHESSNENNRNEDRRNYNVIVRKDYGLFQNKNTDKNNNKISASETNQQIISNINNQITSNHENDGINSNLITENSKHKFIETNNNNVILYEKNDESNIISNNNKDILFSNNNDEENNLSSTKNRRIRKDIKINSNYKSEIVESNYNENNENINNSQRENQIIDYNSSYNSKYKNKYSELNQSNKNKIISSNSSDNQNNYYNYNNNGNNDIGIKDPENSYNDLSKVNDINISLANQTKDKNKNLYNSGKDILQDNQKSNTDNNIDENNGNQDINNSNKYLNLNINDKQKKFKINNELLENNKNINNGEMLQKLKSKKVVDFNYLAKNGNLFSGKDINSNNLNEKFEYISDLNNYLQEEININKDNNLLTPEEAVHYVDDIIIRFLGYFGSELCLRGIKTYIEKVPTRVYLRNIIFRIISSGILTQKNYKLIIDIKDLKSLFEENNECWLNYLENIKSKISKRFDVNEKDIYYFGHKISNYEVNLVIYNQRINGLESFLKNLGFKVSTYVLLNYCVLSPCIFDSNYCKDEKNWKKKSSLRGGKVYEPPKGWYGIGLKIKNRYRSNNDAWLGNQNKEGEWAVAYHGIQKGKGNVFDKILKIMNGDLSEEISKTYRNEKNKEKNNDKYPNCGEGVLLFPSIEDTEKYAEKTSLGFFNLKIQFAFMTRVNVSKIRSPDSLPAKWILNPNSDEIRPYRLLIKIN